jgi:hypothetical protein
VRKRPTRWPACPTRRVDVHYRDLDDVEYHLAEARAGQLRAALDAASGTGPATPGS